MCRCGMSGVAGIKRRAGPANKQVLSVELQRVSPLTVSGLLPKRERERWVHDRSPACMSRGLELGLDQATCSRLWRFSHARTPLRNLGSVPKVFNSFHDPRPVSLSVLCYAIRRASLREGNSRFAYTRTYVGEHRELYPRLLANHQPASSGRTVEVGASVGGSRPCEWRVGYWCCTYMLQLQPHPNLARRQVGR